MSEIHKKIDRQYYDEIASGKKTFELRLADWQCDPGDTLVLDEVDDNRQPTGRSLRRQVGYILKTKDFHAFTPEEVAQYGYQVISLLPEDAL